MGVPLCPQAIRRQVRHLQLSVFMPYFSHLLPSGLAYAHTHMFIHADSHIHSELHARVMPCSACVELLVLLSLINKPLSTCLSIWCYLSYMAASVFWIATRLCFHMLFFRLYLLYSKESNHRSSITSQAHSPTFPFTLVVTADLSWHGFSWVVELWAPSSTGREWSNIKRIHIRLYNKGSIICLWCIWLPYQ